MFAFKYNLNGRLIQALSYKQYKYTVLLYSRNMTLDLGTRHYESLSLIDQPGYGTCSILEVLIFNFIFLLKRLRWVHLCGAHAHMFYCWPVTQCLYSCH